MCKKCKNLEPPQDSFSPARNAIKHTSFASPLAPYIVSETQRWARSSQGASRACVDRLHREIPKCGTASVA